MAEFWNPTGSGPGTARHDRRAVNTPQHITTLLAAIPRTALEVTNYPLARQCCSKGNRTSEALCMRAVGDHHQGIGMTSHAV
jgi:hypothetical protein